MNEQPWSMNPSYDANQLNDAANILKCIVFPSIYTKVLDLKVSYALSKEPVPFAQRKELVYKPLKIGESWSQVLFDCAWFHLEGQLKKDINLDNLYLTFDCNGEALLYSETGLPLKGFTNGSSEFDRGLAEPTKRHYPLKGLVQKDGLIDLYLDAGSNDLFGRLQMNDTLFLAEIDSKDLTREARAYDYEVLLDLVTHIDNTSKIYQPLFDGVIKLRNLYWYNDDFSDKKALEIVKSLYSLTGFNDYSIIAIGHAHLDLAWLWPIRESKRKVLRTISNVFYLLKKYPSFTFALSQPQQIKWIKENEPKLFNELQKYVSEGRIELVGGGFVESDTNLVGEEGMARETLYGQKFYLENFGHYTHIAWLPDTFGYNGSLPQIFALSEQPYFVTTKMSWNTVNQFPYHSFIWKGVDGTSILAHIPPEGTYNSGAYPRSALLMEKNTKPCDVLKEGLMVYGIGDGGAGPSVGHVERLLRMQKTNLMPSIKLDHVASFMNDLSKVKDKLPVHEGEMYLENHQGTYTSESNNKQWNRYMEEKLLTSELVLSSSRTLSDELKPIWEEVLLYQFHDILPGSSIKRVYDETDISYPELNKKLDKILKTLYPSIEDKYTSSSYVYNPLAHDSYVVLKGKDGYGKGLITGHASSKLTYEKLNASKSQDRIETKYFVIDLAKDGSIARLSSKDGGQEFFNQESNHLRVYRDHGDAWNIVDSYREQQEVYLTLDKQEWKKSDSLIEIINHYSFKESKLTESILIDTDSPLIRFHHDVKWANTGYMLKSVFNLKESSTSNHFDIQYGALSRSSENKTSKEKAQFEVPFYKWADVSSKKAGVSFLSKAKDGAYAKGNLFELTLLRSTNYPCVNSDQKETSYDYAIYPHNCAFNEAEVDKLANEFNVCYLYSQEPIVLSLPFVKDDRVNVTSIKRPYAKDGLIVRLAERSGTSLLTSLEGVKEGAQVTLVDLLEESIGNVDIKKLSFHPYEVKTLWIH
jgi:alpha-mannosidase